MAALTGSALRALRKALLEAPDRHVAKVVTLLEELSDRSVADELMAALRPRLAQLGIRRPLGFTRLLFLPLDPMIVPANAWRRESPAIPRSVLSCMGSAVRSALGDEAALVNSNIARCTAADEHVIAAEGSRLWPRAAAILAGPQEIAGWREATGLPPALERPLRRAVAVVLSRGPALYALERAGGDPDEPAIMAALDSGEPIETGAELALLLAVCLSKFSDSRTLLSLADRLTPARGEPVQQAVYAAVQVTLDQIGMAAVTDSGDMTALARIARRASHLIQQLAFWFNERPSIQPQAERLRQLLDSACRKCFAGAMLDLEMTSRKASSQQADVLEAAARRLVGLAAAGRQISHNSFHPGAGRQVLSDSFYDQQLRDFGRALFHICPGLSAPQRARLTEILAGADFAWELLSRCLAAAT